MWLRYAAAAIALAAVLGGVSLAPAAAAETSPKQLRRQLASLKDSEVRFAHVAWSSRHSEALMSARSKAQRAVSRCLTRKSTRCRSSGRRSALQHMNMRCCLKHSPLPCCTVGSCTRLCMSVAQAAILEKCRKQSAAGKGRCAELARYMNRCRQVVTYVRKHMWQHSCVEGAPHESSGGPWSCCLQHHAGCASAIHECALQQHCGLHLQIHGYQCLRCTFSTIKKIDAKDSCCTAVRDAKKYGLSHCRVGELSGHTVVGRSSAGWNTCVDV